MDKQSPQEQWHYFERIRQDFVANVSHELRTPLTVLQGYLEMLLDLADNQLHPWKRIFTQMSQQATRMEQLVEDLLLLARLETESSTDVHYEKVNVGVMLANIVDDARSLSGDRKHEIALDADHTLFLSGLSDELRSAFSNIIVNAVNYTPNCGKIDISWKKTKSGAIVRVSDTGIGIAKKYIPRITERFYRVDKARSRANGGTGLGLAIVKHVLKRHSATLEIESKEGKGSTFSCIFSLERVVI